MGKLIYYFIWVLDQFDGLNNCLIFLDGWIGCYKYLGWTGQIIKKNLLDRQTGCYKYLGWTGQIFIRQDGLDVGRTIDHTGRVVVERRGYICILTTGQQRESQYQETQNPMHTFYNLREKKNPPLFTPSQPGRPDIKSRPTSPNTTWARASKPPKTIHHQPRDVYARVT